jgi:hypothetical protein
MPMSLVRRSLVVLVTAGSAACATGGAGSVAPTPHQNRAMITSEEIPLTGSESAYDLIQRIRPEYLRIKPAQGSRGAGGKDAPAPALVTAGQRVGELTDLRSIAASALSGIRYYSIEEAKLKFGMQYPGGVIELSYRTLPPGS